MYKQKDYKGTYNPLQDEPDDVLGLYENNLGTPLSRGDEKTTNEQKENLTALDHSDLRRSRVSEADSDDTNFTASSGSHFSHKSEFRESTAWYKKASDLSAIPESMNFDEVESIMWRKVYIYI